MTIIVEELLAADSLTLLLSHHTPSSIRENRIAHAAHDLIKAIKSLELYPSHKRLMDRFEPLRKSHPSLFAHRTDYIWQFSQAALQIISLNLAGEIFLRSNSIKCQVSFLGILLDDICDLGRDKTFLDKCILALKGQISQDKEIELYQLLRDTWNSIQIELEQAPNYALLHSRLDEAFDKWVSSLKYCLWLQEAPRFEEKWEKRLEIIPHTSLICLEGLIDLLFFPNLNEQQISAAMQVFLRTQKMIQISNWATTWQRELTQHDFSSAVFTLALEKGWIKWDELHSLSKDEIGKKIHDSPAENYLWDEWEQLRVTSHLYTQQDGSVSFLARYIHGFSVIMLLELAHIGMH